MHSKPYTGRDVLFVKLRCGATKAGAQRDRRRDASRRACRGPVRLDADDTSMAEPTDAGPVDSQEERCGFALRGGRS